jgi:hypothetical protein
MLILIPSLILFLTAFTLMVLRAVRPTFRFGWLTAVGASILALLIVIFMQGRMPLEFSLPPWKPEGLFEEAPSFRGDSLSWLYVLSLAVLNLSILLTAVARPQYASSFAWPGILALSGLGLLAVTANNPLTLLLVWAALDITELISQLLSVNEPADSERVVISFSTRALGIGLLLWANILSVSTGSHLSFTSITAQAGLYLAAAAGLRLGVLPLHLPYSSESGLRRGFGTLLRLVSATSSLVLLSHIPVEIANSVFTPVLLALTVIAAIYGGWTWLRAPDELTGRPFWIIGLAALAVASALTGNPAGSVAWGCALILTGSLLFLSSTHQKWLNRAILLGAWTLSSLPFSLTAGVWGSSNFRIFTPLFVTAQALLIAGFVRHVTRPGGRDTLEGQPEWTHNVYPAGIVFLLLTQILSGLVGWDGALQIGFWPAGLAVSLLTLGLIWATPRLRLLNPIRAHWVRPASSGLNAAYRGLWSLYNSLGRLSGAITTTLEGTSGVMWTLLFLVLFVSLMTQGTP